MRNSVVVFRLTKISRSHTSAPNEICCDGGSLRFNLNSAKHNKYTVDLEVDYCDPYRVRRLVEASQSFVDYCLREAGATTSAGSEGYRARSYALVVELHSRGTTTFLALGRQFLNNDVQISLARALVSEFATSLRDAIAEDRLDADFYARVNAEQWQFVTACYHDYN